MSVQIHPTAIVESSTSLGVDVQIGPFSVLGPNVCVGDRVKIHTHVIIDGHTSLGDGCEVFPFAALGCPPQHVLYKNEPSRLIIGNDCVIREHVTMHPGTALDSMETIVGENGLFFAGAHVAHDCVVGNNVIFANNVALGGHVRVGDHVMLGGFAGIQQRCRVGEHSMVGAHSLVDSDVIPYSIAVGNRAKLSGINVIGLRRRGFNEKTLNTIRDLFKKLFRNDELFASRLIKAQEKFKGQTECELVF